MAKHVIDKDRGWKKIKAEMLKLSGGKAALVGIQSTEAKMAYPDRATLGTIATTHEFGSPPINVPQRSFLRSAFDENRKRYEGLLEKAIQMAMHPAGASILQKLTELGEVMRSDVVAKIKSNISPPWADSTRARKEREHKEGDPTLWDTGTLLGSIRSILR